MSRRFRKLVLKDCGSGRDSRRCRPEIIPSRIHRTADAHKEVCILNSLRRCKFGISKVQALLEKTRAFELPKAAFEGPCSAELPRNHPKLSTFLYSYIFSASLRRAGASRPAKFSSEGTIKEACYSDAITYPRNRSPSYEGQI